MLIFLWWCSATSFTGTDFCSGLVVSSNKSVSAQHWHGLSIARVGRGVKRSPTMTEINYTIDMLFAGKDAVVRATYERLLEALHS